MYCYLFYGRELKIFCIISGIKYSYVVIFVDFMVVIVFYCGSVFMVEFFIKRVLNK